MDSRQVRGPEAFALGWAYVALFLLGALEGVVGCFQFSRGVGAVPVAALGFCVVIFLTCLLGGWGLGSPLGALVPALGWFLVTVVLSMPTRGGSVIVTNTTAGMWYLYGGVLSAGLSLLLSFRWRSR